MLDLIERLAEKLAGTRVLLVCTARLELLETRPTWGAGKLNATTLSLTPLAPAEAAELVSSLLGEAQVPDDVRDRVLAHAEGNPFFLEEMLNMLIDQGVLERRNGGWVSAAGLGDASIPDSVHGVIAARIDLLEAVARDALRRCSVVGRSFWPAAVGVDEDVVDSLRRTGLVTDNPGSAIGGMREFAFKHALTRDVVYSTLPRPERRDLHRQVAEWIQEISGDRDVEAAELAAYHYGEALAYGEDDSAVRRRAVEALLMAGEAAFSRADFVAARAQVERALEFADDDMRPSAQLALVRLDYTEGEFETALRDLDVLETQLAPDDAERRSDMLAWRSRGCWLTGRWDEAFSSAQRRCGCARRPARVTSARASARSALADRDAEASRRGDSARRGGNRRGPARRRLVRRGERPDQPHDRARDARAGSRSRRLHGHRRSSRRGRLVRGGLPGDRQLHLVNARLSVARRDRAGCCRGSAPDRCGAAARDRPVHGALHRDMILVPTGRWQEADDVFAAADEAGVNAATSRIVWLGLGGGLALRRGDLKPRSR